MPTSFLDFDALLAAIPGDQPAGSRVPADVRKKMEDARKEFEPNPEHPSAAPIPKKPDWALIIRLASDSLANKSKDLLAAVRLVEALAKQEGFAGLRDGLNLLRQLMTECWDRIHPLIEEPSDIDSRAGPFEWLNESEGGAWFPPSLRKLPLIRVNGQVACLQDCQDGKIGDVAISPDALRSAQPATESTREDVADCLKQLDALDQTLGEKMADQAPSLMNLRDVLNAAQNYLGYLQAPTADTPAESQPSAPGEAGVATAVAVRPTGVMDRAEAYRQLGQLADYLAKLEPHSPIPDLLRWAVRLGGLPFRDLILEFIREPTVLSDIRRQFGIPEPQMTPTE